MRPVFITSLILLLCGIPMLLSSCLTVSALKTARYDKKGEKVARIFESGIDSAGNVEIIFEATRITSLKRSVYKLSLNTDSLYRYCGKALLNCNFNDSTRSKTGVADIYSPSIKEKSWVDPRQIIVAKNHVNKLVKYRDTDRNKLDIKSYNEKLSFPYENARTAPKKPARLKYVTMILQDTALSDHRSVPLNRTLLISVLPEKRAYWRYWLIPATLTGDIVTLPFQLILFGLLLLLKDVPLS